MYFKRQKSIEILPGACSVCLGVLNKVLACSGDLPSKLKLQDMSFVNWSNTSTGVTHMSSQPHHVCPLTDLKSFNTEQWVVNLDCSSMAPYPNIMFSEFNVSSPTGNTPVFLCENVVNDQGLPGMVSFGDHHWVSF